MSFCAVRADQVWLGLLQEAHERAGFPGLCREHHRALPKQPDILQLRAEDSKKIVLVLPREGWFFHHRPSLPWDASAVTAMGQVTNQHKQRLAADEKYLAASLKVPPPKKKTLKSEGASQRKIVKRQEAGMTLRLRPRPARD